MNELAALDDPRKVRVMAWSVLAAVPLVLLFAGVALLVRTVMLHADGDDVAKAAAGSNVDFPVLTLGLVFFSLASGTKSGTTFRSLVVWFVASELVANLTYLGLLASLGFGIAPAVSHIEVNLFVMPLMILAVFWLFRRGQKRSV